jgi:hypothetical protein
MIETCRMIDMQAIVRRRRCRWPGNSTRTEPDLVEEALFLEFGAYNFQNHNLLRKFLRRQSCHPFSVPMGSVPLPEWIPMVRAYR